jgi:hypothetical protein
VKEEEEEEDGVDEEEKVEVEEEEVEVEEEEEDANEEGAVAEILLNVVSNKCGGAFSSRVKLTGTATILDLSTTVDAGTDATGTMETTGATGLMDALEVVVI